TDEDAVARRRLADARDVVRPFDDTVLEPRHSRWIVRLERRAEPRLPCVLLARASLAPRQRDLVPAGSDRNRRRRHRGVAGFLRDVDALRDAELVQLGAADL